MPGRLVDGLKRKSTRDELTKNKAVGITNLLYTNKKGTKYLHGFHEMADCLLLGMLDSSHVMSR